MPHETVAVSARSVLFEAVVNQCLAFEDVVNVHHTTMHHVTSYAKPFTYGTCVFSRTCHVHFWQNDRDLLRATAPVTLGVERIPK